MGLYDRDYTQADYDQHGGYPNMPRMRMSFVRPHGVVMYLLIANVVIYFVSLLFPYNIQYGPLRINIIEKWFSVFPYSTGASLQLWRLVTYQFLHGSIMHILFNMLLLYFLGPTLERHWGTKRFLGFYLGCGIAGGAFYTLLVAVRFLDPGPMVGASGAILGMLAACAILFPQFVVIIVLFPVPIRVATVIFLVMYIANLISKGYNAGGDAAHLAGMTTGAIYVWSQRWRWQLGQKLQAGAWKRKMAVDRKMQYEVDRILKKVHEQGIHSLTMTEKRILKKATESEQRRNSD